MNMSRYVAIIAQTEKQRAKSCFVSQKLMPMLLSATAGQIADAEYREDGGSEFVEFHTADGDAFEVVVTGRTNWGIAVEVMEAVKNHVFKDPVF